MVIRRTLIPMGLGIIMTALILSMSTFADSMGTQSKERPVPYKKMSMNDYQNFLGNWDEQKYPVLYALISTPARYNALFHPAATMRSVRPFSPDASLYAREQILVVARVMLNPGNVDTVFEVERITESNQELAFHYRFNKQESDAKWHGKIYLAIRIPKHNYKKVHFFENGKHVGELNMEAGQWSVPARIPEPDK
jgi:hypothetical protein